MAESAKKEERLEIRISEEQKSLALRAVAIQGGTLADFVRKAVRDAAVNTVKDHDVVALCAADQEAFAAALLHPPEPGERLKVAHSRFKEQVDAR